MEARQCVNINKNVQSQKSQTFCTIRAPRHIFQSYLKDLSHSDVGGNENITPGRNDFFEQTAAGTRALLNA